MGLDPEAQPLLGLLVPVFGLPPRAPLLPGRAVLQAAPAALRAAPVLRRDRLEDRRPTAGSSAAGSSRTRRRTPTGTWRARRVRGPTLHAAASVRQAGSMADTEDINELIRELNEDRAPAGSGRASGEHRRPRPPSGSTAWLAELVSRAGSDLLLVAGAPPSSASTAASRRFPEAPLSGDEIEEAVAARARPATPATSTAPRESPTRSHRVRGLGRFRINLHRERGRAGAAVRALPSQPPRLASLGLPRRRRGADPAAARASSSSAARPARARPRPSPPSSRRSTAATRATSSRSRTRSSTSTRTARASSSRSRSASTPRTSRPPCAPPCARPRTSSSSARCATPRRCASRSPPPRPGTSSSRPSTRPTPPRPSRASPTRFRRSARTRSARSSRWRSPPSLTQTLLPRKGGGRVAAAELLFVGYGARQHIRKNALQHLHQEIAHHAKQGSITLEESLARLARDGVVETEEARARAAHPEEFENYHRGRSVRTGDRLVVTAAPRLCPRRARLQRRGKPRPYDLGAPSAIRRPAPVEERPLRPPSTVAAPAQRAGQAPLPRPGSAFGDPGSAPVVTRLHPVPVARSTGGGKLAPRPGALRRPGELLS